MGAENSRSKRSVPDIADDPAPGHDVREYSSIVASTSTLVAAQYTKRGMLQRSSSCQRPFIHYPLVPYTAKRAETRECPICREPIPLRLLGQHYTLENSRVQAILDHIGDLEGFSDPHASAHEQCVTYLYTYPSLGSTQSFGGVIAHAVVHKVHAATPRCAAPP